LEHAALQPNDFYAASKVAAEALLRPYARYFRVCALRLFTPYGPDQRDRLIPTLIERVHHSRPIELDGEAGGLQLSLTYVDDVTAVFQAAAEQCWEGAYNIAAPTPANIAEISSAIGRELGLTPIFKRTGRPEPTALVADVSKLATLYDVAAFRTLKEGLELTLKSTPRRAARIIRID
jgi:nucleoside-diphosphate-sugar epimerase